ncbi:MAG: peptidylprolyl isomerase [Thermoanaerobaculia bacterium]|nr:peptidylprolyl isomerase [Thermoanaerobaculia bacterium]
MRRRRPRGLGAGLVLALATAACGGADVIARIDGEDASFGDFEAFVARRSGGDWAVLEERALAALFRQFLDERMLLRWVEDEGEIARGESAREALTRLLAAPVEIGEAEIRAFLAADPDRLSRPERVLVGQLLVPRRELAESLRRRLDGGESFEQVAAEAAGETGVVFGGYRELSRSDLPVAFRELLFSLPEDTVSEVVAADYGFHLFHVVERRPAGSLPWQEAAEEVAAELRLEASDARRRDMLAAARARYRVEVFAGNLPFLWEVGEQDVAGS